MGARPFGQMDGRPVYETVIRSTTGAEAKIITYGAAIRDLLVPLRSERLQRVVLGLNTLEDYRRHAAYFGAIAGRYGNRIARGRFTIDGQAYQLSLNQDGRHSLHGGVEGFDKKLWQAAAEDESSVALTLLSPDGDSGYPGNLAVSCVYRLIGSILRVELTAATDRPTPVNLCQHSYFNLDGGSVLDHTLELAADFYTPTDVDLIPTGEIRAVTGTPYDFRARRPIRHPQSTGEPFRYDINFVLRRDRLESSGIAHRPLAYAGTLASPKNGLSLEVWSTEPGLQVYDGFKLAMSVPGLDGVPYGANAGICLEAQVFPDGPNRPHFPDAILRPSGVYRQITEYRFSAV
jgi:aldose 1-epimerase